MPSQDKALSNTEGKAREALTGASACGPPPQDNPDQQGSGRIGKMSSLDLSRLSTTPPLDEANKSIDSWLENTDTPFESGSPPIRNQENVPPSGDHGLTDPEEQSKEIEALTKGLPNRQGKSGTIAPANTPRSRKVTGSRARAFSAGSAAGNRPHMGPQAKTMEDNDLPRPHFSKTNTGSFQGPISPLPGGGKFSIRLEEDDPNSAEHISSAHAPSKVSEITERSILASQTGEPTSLLNQSTLALGSSSVNNQNLLSHLLEQHQGFHPDVTKYLVDSVAATPSPPRRAEPSLNPQQLPGSTVNAYGLAQPPSSLTFQDAEDGPMLGPTRRHLGELVTEPEHLNYNSLNSRFRQCSDGGCQHNLWCPTAMRPIRPKSRSKRIKHDLQQLWKDCFCRNPDIRLCAGDFVDRAINEPRQVSQNREIFEQNGDKTAGNAESNFLSLNGRLRDAVVSQADEEEAETSPPLNGCTSSNESSITAHEVSATSKSPDNGRLKPKSIFQRWKAMREEAARKRARIPRRNAISV